MSLESRLGDAGPQWAREQCCRWERDPAVHSPHHASTMAVGGADGNAKRMAVDDQIETEASEVALQPFPPLLASAVRCRRTREAWLAAHRWRTKRNTARAQPSRIPVLQRRVIQSAIYCCSNIDALDDDGGNGHTQLHSSQLRRLPMAALSQDKLTQALNAHYTLYALPSSARRSRRPSAASTPRSNDTVHQKLASLKPVSRLVGIDHEWFRAMEQSLQQSALTHPNTDTNTDSHRGSLGIGGAIIPLNPINDGFHLNMETLKEKHAQWNQTHSHSLTQSLDLSVIAADAENGSELHRQQTDELARESERAKDLRQQQLNAERIRQQQLLLEAERAAQVEVRDRDIHEREAELELERQRIAGDEKRLLEFIQEEAEREKQRTAAMETERLRVIEANARQEHERLAAEESARVIALEEEMRRRAKLATMEAERLAALEAEEQRIQAELAALEATKQRKHEEVEQQRKQAEDEQLAVEQQRTREVQVAEQVRTAEVAQQQAERQAAATQADAAKELIAYQLRSSLLALPNSSSHGGRRTLAIRSPNSVVSRRLTQQPVDSELASPAPSSAVVYHSFHVQSNVISIESTSWITSADRDALFEYCAGEDCLLFSNDVELSNAALDAILTAGHSLTETINICESLDKAGLQCDTVEQLVAAIRNEWQLRHVEPTLTLPPPALTAATSSTSTTTIADTDITSDNEWMTNDDRDRLFNYLADDRCHLFSVDVKLSNRALNAILSECRDTDTVIEILNTLNDQSRSFTSINDLTIGMREYLAAKEAEARATVPAINDTITNTTNANQRQTAFSFDSGNNQYSSAWITPSDRDQLFAYLNSSKTRILNDTIKISPSSCDRLLTLTGSVYTCIEVCASLQMRGVTFSTLAQLIEAVKSEMARLHDNRPSNADGNTSMATGMATATNTSQSQALPTRAPSPHAQNRIARDALFQFLSSQFCHLFSQQVKLNNLTLDHLLFVGRGLNATLGYCHWLDERGHQFASIEVLSQSVAQLAQASDSEQSALLQHLTLSKTLFAQPSTAAAISPNTVYKLYVSVQACSETLSLVQLIESDVGSNRKQPFATVDELKLELQRRHSALRVERRREMDEIYKFFQLSNKKLLVSGVSVSISDAARIAEAGRESLRAEQSSLALSIIGQVSRELSFRPFGSVDSIVETVAQRQIVTGVGKENVSRNIPTTPSKQPGAAVKASQIPRFKSSAAPAMAATSRVTAADRDALFDYLADARCELFRQNVSLSNKSLDSLITAGQSLKQTLELCDRLNNEKNQFDSINELKQAIEAARTAHTTAVIHRLKTSAPLTSSDADRDALFTYLAEESNLFNVDIKLRNAALNQLLEAGRGRDSTIATLRQINSSLRQFASIELLAAAIIQQQKELLTGGSSASTIPLSQSQLLASQWSDGDRDQLFDWLASDECQIFSVDVKLGNKMLNILLAAGNGSKPTIDLLRRIQSRHQFTNVPDLVKVMTQPAVVSEPPATITEADRDGLFDWLASETCSLFVNDVKLSNAGLNKLLKAGNGLQPTLTYCKNINTTQRQFGSISELATAVDAARNVSLAQQSLIMSYLQSKPSVLQSVTDSDVKQLYHTAECGEETMMHLERIVSDRNEPYQSLQELINDLVSSRMTELIAVNTDIAVIHSKLVSKTSTLLNSKDISVTLHDCYQLMKAGRRGIDASHTLEFLQQLETDKKSFASVDALIVQVTLMERDVARV